VVSNLGLVRRLSNNIVLAFDGDKAGISATGRASKIALSLGMDVKVADLPEGMDPADLISKQGTDAWKGAIKNSKHIIEFLLAKAVKNFANDPRKIGREIKEKILPYVHALPSSIEKAYFLKKISEGASIAFSALEEDLKSIEREKKFERIEVDNAIENVTNLRRKDYIERKLLGILLWQLGVEKEKIQPEEVLQELAEVLHKTKEDILLSVDKDKNDLIFEAEVFYANTNLEDDVHDLLTNLKVEYLNEGYGAAMKELDLAEAVKDRERSSKALIELGEIKRKIEHIKSGRLKKQ
jgi:DNA primase